MEENEGADIVETSPVSNGPCCKVRTYFCFNSSPSYRKYYLFLLFTSDFNKPLPLDQTAHNLCISLCKQLQKSLRARLC